MPIYVLKKGRNEWQKEIDEMLKQNGILMWMARIVILGLIAGLIVGFNIFMYKLYEIIGVM